ncbi:hypothetical protein HDU91_005493 [Kappamyces sp. JEL0680]|nr:hypothetical protein HDU91_005493 [Kappamyces sp. JEL0680]
MDSISLILQTTPVPFLGFAFELSLRIYRNACQCSYLQHSTRVLFTVSTLNTKLSHCDDDGLQLPAVVLGNIRQLELLLKEINQFLDDTIKKSKSMLLGLTAVSLFLLAPNLTMKLNLYNQSLSGLGGNLQLALTDFGKMAVAARPESPQTMEQATALDQKDLLESVQLTLSDNSKTMDQILDALGLTSSHLVDQMQELHTNMTRFEGDIKTKLDLLMEVLISKSGRKLHQPKPYFLNADQVVYREMGRIGFGSFGEVYEGEWEGRKVAIKKSVKQLYSETLVKEIEAEADKWYMLRHPNILPLWGVCINTDYPFLVMPLMRNGSVLDYLYRNPGLAIGTRLLLMRDIAFALKYLHTTGLVHGDLKVLPLALMQADNVLIDDDGNALVTDFGLSKFKHSTSTMRKTGAVRWIAPELYKRSAVQGEMSDMFAYAMTCYQILTGRVPFFEQHDDDIVKDWIKDGEEPTRTDDIPDLVWTMLTTCWTQKPYERPNFSTVSDTLTSILRGYPEAVRLARVDHSLSLVQSPAVSSLGTEMTRQNASDDKVQLLPSVSSSVVSSTTVDDSASEAPPTPQHRSIRPLTPPQPRPPQLPPIPPLPADMFPIQPPVQTRDAESPAGSLADPIEPVVLREVKLNVFSQIYNIFKEAAWDAKGKSFQERMDDFGSKMELWGKNTELAFKESDQLMQLQDQIAADLLKDKRALQTELDSLQYSLASVADGQAAEQRSKIREVQAGIEKIDLSRRKIDALRTKYEEKKKKGILLAKAKDLDPSEPRYPLEALEADLPSSNKYLAETTVDGGLQLKSPSSAKPRKKVEIILNKKHSTDDPDSSDSYSDSSFPTKALPTPNIAVDQYFTGEYAEQIPWDRFVLLLRRDYSNLLWMSSSLRDMCCDRDSQQIQKTAFRHYAVLDEFVAPFRYTSVSQLRKELRKRLNNPAAIQPLQTAVEYGYTDLALGFVELGSDNPSLPTLFRKFTESGNLTALHTLLQLGVDIDAVDAVGLTAIHIAAKTGLVSTIDFLLDQGATMQPTARRQRTPLHLAVRDNRIEALVRLLERGANINAQNASGSTPLHEAAALNRIDACKKLITYPGVDLEKQDKDGNSALMVAVNTDHLSIVKLLASCNVNLELRDNHGYTALLKAAKRDKPGILSVLVANGADVNEQDNAGWTALHYCGYNSNLDMCKRLVEAGASTDARTTKGESVSKVAKGLGMGLHSACYTYLRGLRKRSPSS